MGVPLVYRKTGEQTITTYDFFDLADGSGQVVLYGAVDSTGRDSFSGGYLTRNTPYSDSITSSGAQLSGSYWKDIDKDFDLDVNKPIVLKGTCSFNIPAWSWGA